ncbi:MAG TPA: glycosyl transferase [Anaerolinea thermolimosa]|uniref:Glycosyl transferase n=1 Tax=Anaerolinea thermolimosa TaxID=229919 RepID=A0A3D1JDH4_9CHLR|nr:glycosyltransferase [Anaerolinea thermolimosa]GAP07635.1 glycosyltransferase [Anaerolinea thermolimosa]HCE16640.1 glycosyl transferase [Anaerolinea thermolimosa]
MKGSSEAPTIAVLIPCYNEAATIQKVISDFQRELPEAEIYVFDNNSTDGSGMLARQAGARVIREKRQGKGFVVASMFRRVEADYYVMVDGDDTYPAEQVHELLAPLLADEADMVVGQRLAVYEKEAFRPLHVFGNHLVCWLVNMIFNAQLQDPMSGYRAFTQEVACSLPITARGFDIETEMTLQLLHLNFVIHEVPVMYRARPEGSRSKLNTYRDGALVLLKILGILRSYKPLTFFGGLGLLCGMASVLVGVFPVVEYLRFQYVYSVPKAILAVGLMMLGINLASLGVLLNTVNFRLMEIMNLLTRQATRR